jgi:AraC-like DNA-binding protein
MNVPFMDMVATYSDTPQRRLIDLRRDGLPEIPALGRLCYTWARPDLPVHRHFGCIEIHYRDRGAQFFQQGGQMHRLQGGELFVTPPDQPHSTGGHPMETGVMYWLILRLPRTGRGLLGLGVQESAAILERLLTIPCPLLRATGRTKPLFVEMLRLHDRPDAFLRTVRMRQTAVRLLLEVIESAAQHAAPPTSARMNETLRMIWNSPEQSHPLRELAKRTHLSVSQFKSRFKAETGISPWQYVLKARIEAAKERLTAGNEPITQIAMQLGFASSQYFATVFKRITGVTPRAYRQGGPAHCGPSMRRDDGQQ